MEYFYNWNRWFFISIKFSKYIDQITLGIQYRFLSHIEGSKKKRRQIVLHFLWVRVGFMFHA